MKLSIYLLVAATLIPAYSAEQKDAVKRLNAATTVARRDHGYAGQVDPAGSSE